MKKILIFSCLVILRTLCIANNLDYSHAYTISEGLAHNGATSIIEDSNGYIWIGTYDGLNRFDGYEMITYKNTLVTRIFPSNRIRAIAEGLNNDILIGTEEGLSSFDCKKNRHTIINTKKSEDQNYLEPMIVNIIVSKNLSKIFCITNSNGILVLDMDYKLIDQFFVYDESGQKIHSYFDINLLNDENILITTDANIYHFNLNTHKHYTVLEGTSSDIGNHINKIDDDIFLYTGSLGVQILKLNQIDKRFQFSSLDTLFADIRFKITKKDKLGNIWLGTSNHGIIHINNSDSIINGGNYKVSEFKLKSDILRVSSIYTDSEYGCWVSTYNSGVYQFSFAETPFHWHHTGKNLDYGILSNSINYICPIDTNRFYVSASNGGFALYNTTSHQFEKIPFIKPTYPLESQSILLLDSRKNIWIRVIGSGFYLVSNGSGKAIRISNEYPEFDFGRINVVAESQPYRYWVGGVSFLKIITLDKNNRISKVEQVLDHPFFKEKKFSTIRTIYRDPAFNFLWIGTENDGLLRVNLEEKKSPSNLEITQYMPNSNKDHNISSSFVTSILRLPNGQLWIGTERGGICKVLESDTEPKFLPYTEKDGLSNNVVKNLWYDKEYNLWASTNIGLNKFDTKTNIFRTFTTEEGLPFEEFWYNHAKLKNGNVILSGLKGFCYFDPQNVPKAESLPRLFISDFQIGNKSIFPGDTVNGRILLNNSIHNTPNLELKADENVISIEVTSFHYANPKNRNLKYQLQPLENDWTEVSSDQRLIKYHGLQPGTYTFKVKASNSLNEYTETKNINITIVPPFWKTYKAYLLYVLLLAGTGYLVLYFMLRIQKLKHNLQIEQLEQDKQNDVNEAKLRFFSNISHEIKTPLTLISGPIEVLADRFKTNPTISEKVQIIQRQSRRISELVQQVHDFQKANHNALKMITSRFCFNDFISDIADNYDFLASNENKTLKIITRNKDLFVLADKDKLEKILNNLLSNSFKYTSTKDTISVYFSAIEGDLIIQVVDTGKGIDPDDLPHIFERFYQSKNLKSEYTGGSGIGLAFTKRLVEMHYGYISASSTVGKGTTITVKLPIIKSEIAHEQEVLEEQIITVEKKTKSENAWIKEVNISELNVSESAKDTRIFLAEDNTEMRKFLTETLSSFFKVESFSNGKECIKAMETEWPDLVISDVLMPEMNGFNLCHSIKSDIKTSHIPVILLTACTADDDQIKGLKDGADAYIHKPFSFKHLVTRIESLLQVRQNLKDRFQTSIPLTLKKTDTSEKDAVFMEKLYSLIEKNLDNQDLDLDSFARELYLNRTDFYKKVKALTNQTPYELLRTYRLQKAAEFLADQQLSISEVVVMTGYKSRAHFSSSFKEKYNVSPGKFATQAKNN